MASAGWSVNWSISPSNIEHSKLVFRHSLLLDSCGDDRFEISSKGIFNWNRCIIILHNKYASLWAWWCCCTVPAYIPEIASGSKESTLIFTDDDNVVAVSSEILKEIIKFKSLGRHAFSQYIQYAHTNVRSKTRRDWFIKQLKKSVGDL